MQFLKKPTSEATMADSLILQAASTLISLVLATAHQRFVMRSTRVFDEA